MNTVIKERTRINHVASDFVSQPSCCSMSRMNTVRDKPEFVS